MNHIDPAAATARLQLPDAVHARTVTPRRLVTFASSFVRRHPASAFCLLVILACCAFAAAPQLFAPMGYQEVDVSARLQGPSGEHWFGTDRLGRDVLSRIIYGSRTAVTISVCTVALSTLLAVAIALLSISSRAADLVMQRLVDMMMSFPPLVFVVFLAAMLGSARPTMIVILSLMFCATASRVIRSEALSVMGRQYVEAARSVGVRSDRILIRHVLPNLAGIILITVSVQLGAVLLVEASISYLGFGPPPPYPSWGRMLNEAQPQMLQHPHLSLFPGAAIALLVLAFNVLGDGVRTWTDPRRRT